MSTSTTELDTSAGDPQPGDPGAGDPPRSGRGRRIPVPKLDRTKLPYALIAPAVVFMLVIHVVPMVAGGVLAFKDLNTFTFQQLFGAPWRGFQNFRDLLAGDTPISSGFTNAAWNTAVYTFWTVGAGLVGGLGFALLLHRDMRGRRVARSLLLVPWVMPTFVVAMLWQNMWQSDIGIINTVLVDWTGLLDERPLWLVGSNSMWAIIVPSIWRGIPLAMLLFSAGLQAIPPELHEAAATDGASAWSRFWHITFPLLRPLVAVQLLFGVVYTAYQFTMPNVMFGSDPGRDADLLMTLVVRESFNNNLVGIGAAVSVLMMLGMFVWVGIWFAAFRRDLEMAR